MKLGRLLVAQSTSCKVFNTDFSLAFDEAHRGAEPLEPSNFTRFFVLLETLPRKVIESRVLKLEQAV